jgi:hypothetical protein
MFSMEYPDNAHRYSIPFPAPKDVLGSSVDWSLVTITTDDVCIVMSVIYVLSYLEILNTELEMNIILFENDWEPVRNQSYIYHLF